MRAEEERKQAFEKAEEQEQRKEKKDALNEERQQRLSKVSTQNTQFEEFHQPLSLNWLLGLLKGFVGNIKRIHIRYEDDSMATRPFSFGVMIDEIELASTDSHWMFKTNNGMRFHRQTNKYVNKELNIARVKFYLNSESEMLVPTSLWEQTQNEKLGILSALDPGEILVMMQSAFNDKGINRHSLVEPFFMNLAVNLNTCYTPAYKHEPFKYNSALLVSKLICSADPRVISDMYEFANYSETLSYCKLLNKYKPLVRI